MDLPKKIFNSLEADDYFGLKVLKNGFIQDDNNYDHVNGGFVISHAHQQGVHTQPSSQYVNDAIVLELKKMNTMVKNQYLDEVTEDLIAFNKENAKHNRIGGRSM